MADKESESMWRVIGESVRGAAHVRTGLPNQDAIGWTPESGIGLPLILTISDGHGSASYFRSDVGARLAVNAAVEVIRDFLENLASSLDLTAAKRWSKEKLPREIVQRWRNKVADHISAAPLIEKDLHQLEEEKGTKARRQVTLTPVRAYGATLLAVAVTESFILYLQLGDGDIVLVSEAMDVSHAPLPADERLLANETTSLCLRNAWRDFRTYFQVITASPPALILVSTDGYGNSFRDEEGFLKAGFDFLERIRSNGPDEVSGNLERWLSMTTERGSGDDITVGLLYRMESLELPAGRVPVQTEREKKT